MAKIEIVRSLLDEIKSKFKAESHKIIDLIESLETNPQKGKVLTNVGGIVIKEIKYKNFSFYFITDGHKIKCSNKEDLIDLLIKFVRMSNKKYQQDTINEIRNILLKIGPEGF